MLNTNIATNVHIMTNRTISATGTLEWIMEGQYVAVSMHHLCVVYVERGADYEFRLSAKNAVDYGEMAVEKIRTPDGSE